MILHYIPNEAVIRKFKPIKEELSKSFLEGKCTYVGCINLGKFLKSLREREEFSDIVIISAHGSDDAVLTKRGTGYDKIFTLEHAHLLANDFTFALSCYTSRELGPKVIEEKGITYVGFNDSIENDFVLDEHSSNYHYIKELEKVLIKIYNTVISRAFIRFINECTTAKEFQSYIEIGLKSELQKLSKLSVDEINSKFNLSINNDSDTNQSIRALLKLEFISKISDFSNKIRLLGEERYIPWFNIHQLEDKLYLKYLLEESCKISDKYAYYKYFLQSHIYSALDLPSESKEAHRLFEEEASKQGISFSAAISAC